MRYLICAATLALCLYLARTALDTGKLDTIPWLRPKETTPDAYSLRLDARTIRIAALALTGFAAFTLWRMLAAVSNPLNVAKLSLALACLTGSACADAVEHRIPNIFPAVLSVSAVILLTVGFFTEPDGLAYIISSVYATVASTICLLLAYFLTRRGIGEGDIKLVAALALMGGVSATAYTLLFSVVLSALAAAFLLLTKRKTMKQTVPFGPFILAGYMLSICLAVF